MKPYAPLGLLYICSYLRSKGLQVEVFDSTFSSRASLFEILEQRPPSVLGIYANLMTRPTVVEILKVARDAGWKTIVGGPEPGAYIDEYLNAGADVVVIGEGELTCEELVPMLQAGSLDALQKVDGIAYRQSDGTVVRTSPRAQIPDLDAQPWPARDAIDFDRYLSTWREHHGQGSVSLITARGCPYHCRWCSHQVFGKTHRRRSPAAVADELEWCVDQYKPEVAWMADDVFTIHHGWLFDYAKELSRRNLHIPFECISRADRLNPLVIETLARMGCFRIWIGSESGSQRILDSMERGVTVEQVRNAVALCKANGIQTGIFLMWGYEGEEMRDIEDTIDHVRTTDPDIFFTTVAYPIKGTPYFSEVSDKTELLKVWNQGSDREVRIRGRHSRRFYSFADKLMRSEVELKRLSARENPPYADVERLKNEIAGHRSNLYASANEMEA